MKYDSKVHRRSHFALGPSVVTLLLCCSMNSGNVASEAGNVRRSEFWNLSHIFYEIYISSVRSYISRIQPYLQFVTSYSTVLSQLPIFVRTLFTLIFLNLTLARSQQYLRLCLYRVKQALYLQLLKHDTFSSSSSAELEDNKNSFLQSPEEEGHQLTSFDTTVALSIFEIFL